MALTIFTGKSGGTTVTFNSVDLLGWRKITIDEKGKPLPTPVDITDSGDSTYTFVDDPLGGKTSPSASVSVEGFLSVTDKKDGIVGWLQFAPGDVHDLIVVTAALGDKYTLASAALKTFNTGAEVAGIVPYTATFTHSTSAGAWSTAV
jgi:hypothetical protein